MRKELLAPVAAMAMAGCNSNSSPGADRAAELDTAPSPAPLMQAAEALSGVATEIIALETMSDADVAALGGREGRCAFRMTSVAFPSFYYEPGGPGAIKLNAKLIPLPRAGANRFSDDGLSAWLRPVEGKGSSGLPEYELIVMLPGAKDELGYRGYLQCFEMTGSS